MVNQAVTSVTHFHCDHFEPYTPLCGADGNQPAGPEYVEAYLQALRAMQPFKLSAFFSSQSYIRRPDRSEFHSGGDRVAQDEAILRLLKQYEADIQVHVHHESWPADGAALQQLLVLMLQQRQDIVGIDARTPWSFIHGCWALQASDTSICLIEDELSLLMNAGCVADFSFPAGRPHCNPRWKAPSLVLPVVGRKGYDQPLADPKPLPFNGGGAPRLLIWSSRLAYEESSLECIARSLPSPEHVVNEWLGKSPVIDGALYIKTHAHSLNYSPSPSLTPVVQSCFDELQNRCHRAGLPLRWATASEVTRELLSQKG